jgi:hypothetical protein
MVKAKEGIFLLSFKKKTLVDKINSLPESIEG